LGVWGFPEATTVVRKGLIIILLVSLAAVPRESEAVPATVSPAASPAGAGPGDVLPVAVSAYASVAEARTEVPAMRDRSESGSAVLLARSPEPIAFSAADDEDGSGASYLPVLFSFLVPGTGELYLGHYVRGGLLLGAEITAWVGYAHYHNQGLDKRAEYEAFADAHWDYDRWIDEHLATEGLVDPTFEELDSIGQYHWDQWPGYHTYYSKEEERQNYYETIGKYDWFISGWEDWDGSSHDTSLRTTYRGMRIDSNDDFDTADKFIYLSVATRVFSLIDTYLLMRGSGKNTGAPVKTDPGWSFEAHATGPASGQVSLLYRFQ
jgi:hypothetical protein